MDKRTALIRGSINLGNVADADIVIEAVFERMDVKQDIFRKLDAIVQQGAILASNTSTLDVDKIAAVTTRPQEVIGHALLLAGQRHAAARVVRGKQTAKDVPREHHEARQALKKVAVVSGVCDGFIGNRMLEKYGAQSLFLLDEGASPQRSTRRSRHGAWRWAHSRCTTWRATTSAGKSEARYQERPDFVYSRIADRILRAGPLRPEDRKGFYRYESGSRKPVPDPAVDEIISSYRKELSVKPRAISDEEIVERCIYALVNEGAHILEEGSPARLRHRHGVSHRLRLPPYRGGPIVLCRHRWPRERGRRD